jgi:hypothetical protein
VARTTTVAPLEKTMVVILIWFVCHLAIIVKKVLSANDVAATMGDNLWVATIVGEN